MAEQLDVLSRVNIEQSVRDFYFINDSEKQIIDIESKIVELNKKKQDIQEKINQRRNKEEIDQFYLISFLELNKFEQSNDNEYNRCIAPGWVQKIYIKERLYICFYNNKICLERKLSKHTNLDALINRNKLEINITIYSCGLTSELQELSRIIEQRMKNILHPCTFSISKEIKQISS